MLSRAEDPDAWALAAATPTSWAPFEWAAWTGTRFSASGRATGPGALTQVHVALEADGAVDVEGQDRRLPADGTGER